MPRYFHPIANSTFIVDRGESQHEVLVFRGGHLDVDAADTVAVAALDAIADKPGCPVSRVAVKELPGAREAADLVKDNAAEAVKKIAGSKVG